MAASSHSSRRRKSGHQGGKALAERLRFESFLLELSAAFAGVPANEVNRRIEVWLGKLAAFIRVDRSSLWEFAAEGQSARLLHFHSALGLEQPPDALDMSWLAKRCRRGKPIVWSQVPRDIPRSALAERAWAKRIGAKSVLCLPMTSDSMLRVLIFVSRRGYRNWTPHVVQRLRLVSEIFCNAILRERVASALQSSEARNRAILKAYPDLMFVLSPAGVYLDYHSADDDELIVPPERFLGRNIEEILPRDIAEKALSALARAAATGDIVEFEYALPIAGEMREYEARMVRRSDEAIVCIVRNVTERRRAERQLRESEQRFRGAFAHSAIGIALVSLEGRWLQVNAAICRILGYSADELLTTTFQALTFPEDIEPDMQYVRRALAGEIDHYELRKRYLHKDGRVIAALLTVSIVRNARGEPLYFVSQVQDLTDRTRAQLEIERLRAELMHFGRVALMGQLTASLAHELLQPLTAALANAEAGKAMLASQQADPEETRAILADIVDDCGRAVDIIDGVRRLLRKERKPLRGVNLNRLVRGVADVMHSDLIRRQVRLTMRLDEALPDIDADAVEVQQLVLNLILNGAEALAGNAATEREVVISTGIEEGDIKLKVRDSGIGVDPEDLQRMFDPFFTTKPDGMGMGLAICADIVRGHGGRLWAENNEDGGITVHCRFPRAGQAVPEELPPVSSGLRLPQRERGS